MRHFISVAECGTFSRASEVLHLTQPALTRSIQTLEDVVGAQLFTRVPRGVALTPAGDTLLRHAKLMVNQASAAKEEVAALEKGTAGQLEIGLAPMFSATIIHDVLTALNQEFPGLSFRVTSALFSNLLAGLKDGTFDVVLSNIPPAFDAPDLEAHALFNTRSFILAGASHPLANEKHVSSEALQQATWAVVEQTAGGDALPQVAQANGFSIDAPAVSTNSLSLLKTLLLSGKFLSVLTEHWIAEELAAGSIKRLATDGTPLVRTAGVITRRTPSRAASAQLFLEKARLFAQGMPA
ncbi:MAG: LysR family transcriptional regulator [Pseudomonadota bacterium]